MKDRICTGIWYQVVAIEDSSTTKNVDNEEIRLRIFVALERGKVARMKINVLS